MDEKHKTYFRKNYKVLRNLFYNHKTLKIENETNLKMLAPNYLI